MNKGIWREKWEVVKELQGGGQGVTFKVKPVTPNPSSFGVLKVLRDQKSEERRARFVQEVTALRTLTSPNVAQLLDSNADRFQDFTQELFLVTEFIEGPNLAAYRATTTPSLAEAVALVKSLLKTLVECHARNVLHRDIKPANIILRAGDPKDPVLIDFGLSASLEPTGESYSTDEGQHLGNRFVYLPEYHTREADKRTSISDVTQVVAILYFLITGVAPESLIDDTGKQPQERNDFAAKVAHLSEHERRQLHRIFVTAFRSDASRRWQSIAALQTELGVLIAPPAEFTFADSLRNLRETLTEDREVSRLKQVDQLFSTVSRMLTQHIPAAVNAELKGHATLSCRPPKIEATGRRSWRVTVRDAVRGKAHEFVLDVTADGDQVVMSRHPRNVPPIADERHQASIFLHDPDIDNVIRRHAEQLIAHALKELLVAG